MLFVVWLIAGEGFEARAATQPVAAPPDRPVQAQPTLDAFGNPIPPASTAPPGTPGAGSPFEATTPGAQPASSTPAAGLPSESPPATAAVPGEAPKTPTGPSVWDSPDTSGAAAAEAVVTPGSTRRTDVYGERIDGLRRSVDELKDKIFRSKARLALLEETVLHGVLSGSRVVITHHNGMGSLFKLTRVEFAMDGAAIYARADDAVDDIEELTIFDGNLVPGPHVLTIRLVYRGHGFGVFSYLNGYTFETKDTYSFTAEENGSVRVVSRGYERGNFTTEMRDRPAVDWQIVQIDATGKARQSRSRRSAAKASKIRSGPPARKAGSSRDRRGRR